MVLVGIRKEQIKSIIVTKDREFKRKAIAFLNGSAFAAEKFSVESMGEGMDVLERDPGCINFIFDGCALSSEDLRAQVSAFAKRLKNPEVRLLVYLDESFQAGDRDAVAGLLPTANLFYLPQAQAHFNKAFHGIKPFPEVSNGHRDPDAPHASGKDAGHAESSSASTANKANLTLIETSAHIKETVDMLNAVSRDKGRIDIVRTIGQRFNGLIGACSFFGNAAGYAKLRDLSTVIDAISRTYRDDTDRIITDDHWNIMMDSAKTLYLILKDMRDNRPITANLLGEADSLISRYAASADIDKRDSQSQEEVDALIEAELSKYTG